MGRAVSAGGLKQMKLGIRTQTDTRAELDDVLMPGTRLQGGRYGIRSFLCSGGFGNTYLARDASGREVVVKECFVPAFNRRSQSQVLCRSEMQRQSHARVMRSLLDEASALDCLSHPNIVRALEAFQENGTAYLVLDRVSGTDLQQLAETAPDRLTPDQVVQLARQLVSALVHVHAQGLLHCDISPDNVCVTPQGTPVLIDFGSARRCVRGVSEPHDGFTMVKDGYSPPELYTPRAALGPQGLAQPWDGVDVLGGEAEVLRGPENPVTEGPAVPAFRERQAIGDDLEPTPCRVRHGHSALVPPAPRPG